jgi:hypothetical protein
LSQRRFRHRRIATLASIAGLAVGATALTQANGQPVQRASQAAAITTVGEPTDRGAPQLNPCTLVTASEAQGATGAPMTGLVEAPLGPTCIYKRGDSKRAITLAVELMDYSAVARNLTNSAPITVGTHPARCGGLGAEKLFLSLSGGRVLNVTAPCPIAKLFAIKAVSRLGG